MHTRTALAATCGVFVASTASAGIAGLGILDLEVLANGDSSWTLANNLEDVTSAGFDKSGTYIIEGFTETDGWTMEWSFEVNQAGNTRGGFDSASISTAFVFTNTTGNDNALFEVIANAAVGSLSSPTTQTGSISGSLLSGNPVFESATLYTPANDFLYTALVDGSGVQTLIDDTFSLSTTLTDAFGPENFLGQPGGGVLNTIGIRHSFGLTDTDNASFAGVFVVTEIPAPGAAALIGLGGLAATRRRR